METTEVNPKNQKSLIKPAKLEDKIQIYSRINSVKKVSFSMSQMIKLNKQNLVEAEIHLATVNKNGKPTRMPEFLIDKLIK